MALLMLLLNRRVITWLKEVIMNISVVLLAVIIEIVGAVLYLVWKNSVTRTLFSVFSLSFMFVVVFMDLLPDTGMYSHFDITHISLFIVGLASIYAINAVGRYLGNYAAVAGLGFHNLCEGVEIAAISALSPMVLLGFLLHKLPEGMVSFSLMDGVKDTKRFIASVIVALLIPVGALIPVPETLSQSVMAYGAGVITMVVIRSIIQQIEMLKTSSEISMVKLGSIGCSGLLVGAVSCLIA